MSFIVILPPTNLDPGTQWFAKYSSTGTGSALCLDKTMGAHLFESPVRKYTSSNSMVSSCVPIWNPCSAMFHSSIICSRRRISFFIFCILKNLKRPQFLNVARVQGLLKETTSLRSCSLYFHSIMIISEVTCNHQQPKFINHIFSVIFG